MGRKCGLGNSVSFNGITAHKEKLERQSSVFSTATQSTIEAGASRRSFSEGAVTTSSEGTQLTCQSSIRRVVSLEPALPLHKEIIYLDGGRVVQDQLVDDVQSNFKVISKDKHLMSESSSSNSSLASVPNHSESKKQQEISVETKFSLSDEKSKETDRFSSVGPVILKKDEFSEETVKQLNSCSGQATSEKMKQAESVTPEAGSESKEATPNLCGFDLNEDLDVNEVEQMKNPIDEPVSSYPVANLPEPIVVVAKVGVPNGVPSAPLRFNGELGWRSAATSAFRPVLPSKNSTDSNTTPSLGLRGFDLNVALSTDCSAMDSEIGLNESERLTHNLSCRGENYGAQPKSRIQSFDLNDNLVDQDQSRGCLPADTMKGSARQNSSTGVRPAYLVELSSMPGFTHVQGQPFLVAAPMFSSAEQKQTLVPLQPTMAFTPASTSGYCIGTTNGLSSSIYSPSILPHIGFHHQIPGYLGSLQLLETATTQGLNPSGYTTMRPSFFLNGGVGSFENTNKVAANAPVDERIRSSQTLALPALAMKRGEPESGWDSYQLNHRNVTGSRACPDSSSSMEKLL